MMVSTLPFADLSLARRLERAEGVNNARSVEARARLFPERGACWIEVAGALAMFDGPSSPITQTFALGLSQMPTVDDMARIEAFYHERGAPVYHEVSPIADVALLAQLVDRGYQPIEFTSVLYRSIAGLKGLKWRRLQPCDPAARARRRSYARTRRGMARIARRLHAGDGLVRQHGRAPAVRRRARRRSRPVRWSLCRAWRTWPAPYDPRGRRRGAQLALLERAAAACGIARFRSRAHGAQPGRPQRNAERHGFRIAYTRAKWKR
jgi:hypothetical protein